MPKSSLVNIWMASLIQHHYSTPFQNGQTHWLLLYNFTITGGGQLNVCKVIKHSYEKRKAQRVKNNCHLPTKLWK